MKIILSTLNSKFIHTSLALRYLKTYAEEKGLKQIELKEYTINHHLDEVVADLYKVQAEVYCFSCYIFNYEETMRVIQDLRKVMPNIKIIVGGPEVSYDSVNFLVKHPEVDIVIQGEGEETFYELIQTLQFSNRNFNDIQGIVYREAQQIIENPQRPLIENLDRIPFPYKNELSGWEHQILYYEASRGCPFRCQYCLSSTIKGVRVFSLDRVKQDLHQLLTAKVRQVKFVDRTFNCNKKRTLEIWKFIKEHDNGKTNFHFEMAADLIDEEMLEVLQDVRLGLFQFEIGVQSTNPQTLEEIQRTISFDKLSERVQIIESNGNIHQHLDLIAGLPYEGYESFGNSFNDVYNLGIDKIQLGFLKLLKGAGVRERADLHGYVYRQYPPYEVLSNKYITYEEILRLKMIEEMVEKYYNSHSFEYSLQYMIQSHYQTPFHFFEDYSLWWEQKQYHHISHKQLKLYQYLYEFCEERYPDSVEIFRELLKFDLLLQEKVVALPTWCKKVDEEGLQKKIFDFYWNDKWIRENMPTLLDVSPKQRSKVGHIEGFLYDPITQQKQSSPIYYLFAYPNYNANDKKTRYCAVQL